MVINGILKATISDNHLSEEDINTMGTVPVVIFDMMEKTMVVPET